MIQKKYNSDGQKARQRDDIEDRSIPYRNWIRTVKSDGFFADIDLIKFKNVNGKPIPVAITELTRCDSESVGQKYLDAIIARWFKRDKQAEIIISTSEILNIPAYLICFQKDMKWLWVFSFRRNKWKYFTPEEWALYMNTL